MTSTQTITYLSDVRPLRDDLAVDARRGLVGSPKLLPPKYFYDARGSELFEAITELPEYYPTRTETAILRRHAQGLVDAVAPRELVELGSGASRKTRLLLEAMHRSGTGDLYVPVDISGAALVAAAEALRADHPWLEVRGYVGDFATDLPRLPRTGRRLLAFLGSTIGNLGPTERAALFGQVAEVLEPGDAFLLGADLAKPAEVLVPAYDDSAGVTAAFNRNMLRVINEELDGNVPVEAFAHRAVWDRDHQRIEMHLVARWQVTARLAAIDLPIHFAAGEVLVTEYSYKFEVDGLRRELAAAGLHTRMVVTDDAGWFALLLAEPGVSA